MINYLNIEMPSFRASSSQEVSYFIIGAVHAQPAQTAQLCPAFLAEEDARNTWPHRKWEHLQVGGWA